MEFQIIFYKNDNGRSPVEEFLDELEIKNKVLYSKALKGLQKLKNSSYHREPLSKYLEPGLWELRIKSGNNIARAIYTFKEGQIIILIHGFVKKQQKTPISDLEVARARILEIERREQHEKKKR